MHFRFYYSTLYAKKQRSFSENSFTFPRTRVAWCRKKDFIKMQRDKLFFLLYKRTALFNFFLSIFNFSIDFHFLICYTVYENNFHLYFII